MRAASEDIRDLLVANLGYVIGSTLHRGKQPDNPDNCATIYDTGAIPELDLCKFENNSSSVQIKVRGSKYQAASDAAEAIATFLNGYSNTTFNGLFIESIMVTNGPEHMDFDHKDRVNFIINLDILRRT